MKKIILILSRHFSGKNVLSYVFFTIFLFLPLYFFHSTSCPWQTMQQELQIPIHSTNPPHLAQTQTTKTFPTLKPFKTRASKHPVCVTNLYAQSPRGRIPVRRQCAVWGAQEGAGQGAGRARIAALLGVTRLSLADMLGAVVISSRLHTLSQLLFPPPTFPWTGNVSRSNVSGWCCQTTCCCCCCWDTPHARGHYSDSF